MGAWGTGIYSNDVAEDVKDTYIGLLKSGKSDDEALNDLISDFNDEIDDEEDTLDFYFALADVMWKYGRLTEEIKKRALDNIEIDLKCGRWTTKQELKQREKKLSELKAKFDSPMPERKKVSIHKPYKIGLKANDIFYYQLPEINKWVTNNGDVYTEEFEKYAGKFIIVYVMYITQKDWQIKGIPDEMAMCRMFLTDEKPESPDCILTAETINCMFQWYEKSARKRAKGMKYLGNYKTERNLTLDKYANDYPLMFIDADEDAFERVAWDFSYHKGT